MFTSGPDLASKAPVLWNHHIKLAGNYKTYNVVAYITPKLETTTKKFDQFLMPFFSGISHADYNSIDFVQQ